MWFIVSLYNLEWTCALNRNLRSLDRRLHPRPGVNDNDRLVTVSSEASDCHEPCAAPISGLFVPGNLHYLHVKCCLVHHRKLNHGRFCISIWILRQKLRLINNKILFCIFCNEFYCCCWRISEPAPASISADPGPGVTLCLPNQFQPSKSNNNHVIVIKISHFTSRAGEARYSRESPAWY